MCGLCGAYFYRGLVDRESLTKMRDIMSYRGPDSAGLYISSDGAVGLGHRRLSIIDLSQAANQPMVSPDGRYRIVLNGEIYNYLELREELKRRYQFRTSSDTEVLLACFSLYGLDCLAMFNGMFALAVYDAVERRLILARDPAGVKPLYYLHRPDRLLFSSEIKGILAYDDERGSPDFQGLADYLTFQYTLDDKTMFKGINKLAPGTWLTAGPNGLRQGRYFEIEFNPVFRSYDEAVQEFEIIFSDSIRLQLRSDVPLGCHLSGGLDTGLIAGEAVRQLDGPLEAFSAGFKEGGIFDDTAAARITADHLSLKHHIIYPDKSEFLALLGKLIWHMDEPAAGEGLFPQYCVSELAVQRVKVVLGGQGADELFGGYVRYFLHLWLTAITQRVLDHPAPQEFDLPNLTPSLPLLKDYWPLWQQVMNGSPFPDEEELFFRSIWRCPDLSEVLSPEAYHQALDGYSPREAFGDIFKRPPATASSLDKILFFETTQWLPALLQVEDRMSMAHSLESRVPFLDPRLMKYAFKTPGEHKMRDGQTKSLIRTAASRQLPEAIYTRKAKIGFPVPIHSWDLGRKLPDLLGELPADFQALFQPGYLKACMAPSTAVDRRLWGWLCLALWWKNYIE